MLDHREDTRAQDVRTHRLPCLAALLLVGCASAGPFVPDTTQRIPPPGAREGADASDVFLRAPWEIWRTSHGPARYHREAHVLLPTETDHFTVGDISVYQADGSDVRLDYDSVDLGRGSQSRESISVFVHRLRGSLDSEWSAAVERIKRKLTKARPTEAFPIPDRFPSSTRQTAMLAELATGEAVFAQVTLFQEGAWVVGFDITCPAEDIDVARERTRWFLRSLRVDQ
jgi:hypothetical protein